MKDRAMFLSHMGALAALAAMAAPTGVETINVTRPTGKRPALAAPYTSKTSRAERRVARSSKKHKLKGLRP